MKTLKHILQNPCLMSENQIRAKYLVTENASIIARQSNQWSNNQTT